MKIINPATETLIKEISVDTPQSINEKFKQAALGQKCWAATPAKERAAAIKNFRDLLVTHRDRLANILTEEMGKPISQSTNELKATPSRIDFFLENFEKVFEEEMIFEPHTKKAGETAERISFEPLGVVANISAWNYPYFVGTNVFIPALLTGNSVLYKPSEFSSLTGLAIAELMVEAGVPKDVFIPIIGDGTVGVALLEQPIAAVFFTGSYGTGVKINQQVASRLLKVQLELGGKDPVYVCEDVDLSSAVASTADGAFYNTGQSCCSVERIYVHEKIYDRFVSEFLETVKGFKMGDPRDQNTYIGPLARDAQRRVLENQISDAVNKGAQLRCGGIRGTGKGYYFEPTVLTHVSHKMAVMMEESFGPIIGIQKVVSDEEAIKLMNDNLYGLTAGVYSKSAERARTILSEINAGTVYWNCCDRVSPKLPWTGRKYSGMGSTLSLIGIRAFVQPKAWHLRIP